MTRARDLADYISTGVSDTELDVLDGVTAGTVTASKALVVDANKDIATIRNITSSGTITGVTSLTVDDITIDGSTISDGADFTIDSGGDITLDADGADIRLKDGGTEFAILHNSGYFGVYSTISDADILIQGNDGGSFITALTLDMSDAGTATFNHDVKLPDSGILALGAGSDLTLTSDGTNGTVAAPNGTFTIDAASTLILDADNGSIALKDGGVQVGSINMTNTDLQFVTEVDNRDMIFTGKDGGSFINALTLDMSDAGKATFNSDVVASRFVDSANTAYYVDPFATSVLAYSYLQQSYGFNTALSGTTPTINAGQFSSFSLTTSGNTTFTFSVNSVATGYLIGFVLKLTAGGGHTITYPNTVDFAGGAAPDAPASGETDILVFTTIDAGTTWYGTRAIDAAS